jgi:putative membrane protein
MKRVKAIFVAGVLVVGASVFVFMPSQARGETQEKTLDESLKDIQQSQGVGQTQSIDCNKVTNQQFEELGAAFVSAVHPNPQQHEFMTRMMGGAGSPSLAYMNRMMGAQYIGCYNGSNDDQWYGMGNMMGYGQGYGRGYAMMGNGPGYGMMGPGMMRNWSNSPLDKDNAKVIERRQTMMGYGYGPMMGFGYMGGFMWLFWILIVALIYMMLRSCTKRSDSSSGEKPLDILKKRYAKGEIAKEEFDKMKKDLEA